LNEKVIVRLKQKRIFQSGSTKYRVRTNKTSVTVPPTISYVTVPSEKEPIIQASQGFSYEI